MVNGTVGGRGLTENQNGMNQMEGVLQDGAGTDSPYAWTRKVNIEDTTWWTPPRASDTFPTKDRDALSLNFVRSDENQKEIRSLHSAPTESEDLKNASVLHSPHCTM